MSPPRVCLEPRRLAVISGVAGSLPHPCGVVYGNKVYFNVVVVGAVGTYVGRLPIKIIIFALFGF